MRNKIKELQVRTRNSGLENQKQKNENQIQKGHKVWNYWQ